jgi:hypothetical protein
MRTASSWPCGFGLAIAIVLGLPAGASATPLSAGASAISAAADETGTALIEVKKGGKHFKHGKFKPKHHGWHRGWNRGRHYGWYRY